MNYIVAKPFSAKIDGKQMTFRPRETVDLPEGKAAKLILAGMLKSASVEVMEQEYFTLLSRYFSIDDTPPGISDEEADRVLARLDILFRELTRQGRKVPVRLPVEKRKVA